MKILIIYGTSEGQTRKIARFMEEKLQDKGYKVVIADSTEEPPTPTNFDAVLVGCSVHMHKYQNSVRDYILKNSVELNSKLSAFFSVSLAVASDIEEELIDADKIAKDFLEKTGWTPTKTEHIAGALKFTQYDYFKRLIMRMIANKKGGKIDTSIDHEYTNWGAVEKFIFEFVKIEK